MIGYSVVNSKGQVTIPADIRLSLGIVPGMQVLINKLADTIFFKKVPDIFSLKGSLKSAKKFDSAKMRKDFVNYLATNK